MTPKLTSQMGGDQRPDRWLARPHEIAGAGASADASATPAPEPEARAIALLRAGDWQPVLDPAARARIFRELQSSSRSAVRAYRQRRPTLRWAFAAALLLTSGGMIASATVGHWPRLFSPMVVALPAPAPAPAARKARAARADRRVAVIPGIAARAEFPAPAPDPTPAETDLVIPAPPAPVSPPRAPAARASVRPPTSALSDESQLLGRAMIHLRQQRDAAAALDDLERYAARFPRGILKREASIARIDALLMLNRERRALALLRQLDLKAQDRDQELRVIRGELMAGENCTSAMVDFDRVLLESPDPALIQRALYGRAGCRLRRGDDAGAVRDLDQYLLQFPHGRFAGEARQARAGVARQ